MLDFALVHSRTGSREMKKKPKYNVERAFPDLALESAGFAHGMNLLLLAIAKTNPAIGVLLDEFTAMHAEYLAELQGVARDSVEHPQVLEKFSQAAKLIYKRLSALDSEQSSKLCAGQQDAASSMSVH